jgi:hypothetical protein
MKKLLREPLTHFLLLGAAIFFAFHWISGHQVAESGHIVITQSRIENLAATFARTWQRPPTATELDGLIRDYVREEVATREALALGLDRDDTIIRRRLRQKLEFVSEDVAAQAQPTDDELRAYWQAREHAFRAESRFTFRQIYFNPKRHGDNLARDIAQLLAELQKAGAKANTSALGDPVIIEHQFDAAPVSEIVQLFGEKFAQRLGELPTGQWQGPVESGYGVHLVFVSERTEGRMPTLQEVRDTVRREWANARRLEANEQFYQALVRRYTVTIENWPPTSGEKQVTELLR